MSHPFHFDAVLHFQGFEGPTKQYGYFHDPEHSLEFLTSNYTDDNFSMYHCYDYDKEEVEKYVKEYITESQIWCDLRPGDYISVMIAGEMDYSVWTDWESGYKEYNPEPDPKIEHFRILSKTERVCYNALNDLGEDTGPEELPIKETLWPFIA